MTNKDALIGFTAGLIAGAAIAMLYAPQSGAEVRKRIRDTTRDAGMKMKGTLDDVKVSLDRTVADAAGKVADGADRLMTAVDRGREVLRERASA